MSKARFKLKEPNSKSETLIYLQFYYQYKEFKYSTGEKIHPKFWNKELQRVKNTKNFPEYPEFNARLDKIENAINNAFRILLNDNIQPNNNLLRKEFEIQLSEGILRKRTDSLFEFIEQFINENINVKKQSTVCVYKSTFKHIQNYSKSINQNIDFNFIDLSFYNNFTKYLSQDLKMSNNTIGKHIKTLKTFLNEATERGLNQNLDYKKRKFKTLKEDSDKVYLSMNELKIIGDLDLSKKQNLERVRDLFLLGCFTGLRFSDFSQIKKENIDNEKSIIKITTQKTKEKVTIPIHPLVKNILAKYNNTLPKALTNQNMNKCLKEIAELARIDKPIECTITKAGILQKNTFPKYELITTHTARRSFATNLYLADVPSISIMKITGHRTEKSFLKYIKVTQEQNADKLLNHPFFK